MIELKTDPFPHQEAAIEKLKKLKVGALYMEPGTGKTRTVLGIAQYRLEQGKFDYLLWLCPCSVRQNLKEDIEYHCGEVPKEIIIRGIESLSSSDSLYIQLYELVRRFRVMLVVDESDLVKNPSAIRTKRITTLSEKCRYKMILNGTPVSRTEADMYAQWMILDWRILGYKSYYSFEANHIEYKRVKTPSGKEVKTDQIARILNKDYLAQKIAPYTVQARRQEVLDLPEMHYYSRSFPLSVYQYDQYVETRERFLEQVDDFRSETIYKLFTALQHVSSGREVISEADERMETRDMFDDIEDNPRIDCLDKILRDDIKDEQCIVFAKYQREVEEIKELLKRRGRTAAEFTGHVKQSDRQVNRKRFMAGEVQFLIANKSCGAYGLNLQCCHNIIFYSNDFNYSTREQAEDRIHRLGQTHDCSVYDIYAKGTIDGFIAENLGKKVSMVEAFKKQIKKWKDVKITKKTLSQSESLDPATVKRKPKKTPAA